VTPVILGAAAYLLAGGITLTLAAWQDEVGEDEWAWPLAIMLAWPLLLLIAVILTWCSLFIRLGKKLQR